MTTWTSWLARLGMAGTCFVVAGCGGGDVPDASNDGMPASGTPVEASSAPEAAPAPVAADEPKVAQADPPTKAAAAPVEQSAAEPEPEPPAPVPKAEQSPANSSTAEMLAIASGPPGGGSAPPADGTPPPGDAANGNSTPGGAGGPGPGGPGAMMRPGGLGGPGAMPGGGMGPGGPGAGGRPAMGAGGPGGPTPADMGRMARMNQEQGRRPGSPPPMDEGGGRGPGGGRPGGGGGVDNGPVNLHSPDGAVKAFLSALKAKDLDRLNESTALRAQTEASGKNQELFRQIFDLSLSDSQLDELATKLEGYTIAGENPPKSTGRVEVILRKSGENGSYFLRKVTVRHEKKGWGVMDIAGAQQFKSMSMMPKKKR